MLYVPLLFYLFDRLSERSKEKRDAKSAAKPLADGSAAAVVPHGQTEDS
jgi:hypothetical protein